MADTGDWKEIELEGTGIRLRSPVDLTATGTGGIDSRVTSFRGPNLEVTVDEGPFADPLTGHGDRPEHRATEETIGGRPARAVTFRLDDQGGGRLAAAHFEAQTNTPGAPELTVSVVGREALAGDVPLQVVRSLQFV